MISIILPFFNAEKYLRQSIESVLNQSYTIWELILINDGSNDKSKEIALCFNDNRIKYFEQKNHGVSIARNLGLSKMTGDYFCFLDSDDILPINSLISRLKIFKSNSAISFVDGKVLKMDSELRNIHETLQPSLKGDPLKDLIRLNGGCFLGLTWMIKKEKGRSYKFQEGLTHGEDLFFYMELARNSANYDYTDETVLYYRNTPNSAMKDLNGLEKGYSFIESNIKKWPEVTKSDLKIFKRKYKKAMLYSYINHMQFKDAFYALRKFI